MYVQVSPHTICNLNCDFCLRSIQKPPIKRIGYHNFEDIISKYTKDGELINIDLTPVMGELFCDEIYNFFELLEKNEKVKHYDFVTNLIVMPYNIIEHIMLSKKCSIYVSIYGHDDYSYKDFCGSFSFDRFLQKLERLEKTNRVFGKKDKIHFYLRHSKLNDIPMCKVKKLLLSFKYVHNSTIDDSTVGIKYNWGGQAPWNELPKIKKDSICLNSIVQTCVLHNKKVSLCGLVDGFCKMQIGNLNIQSVEQIYKEGSIYQNYIEEQSNGIWKGLCENCDEYEPWYNEKLQVVKHIESRKFLEWMWKHIT